MPAPPTVPGPPPVNPPLATARLRLEPLVAAHADALYPGLGDPALYRYLDEAPPPGVEALRRRYAALESRASPDGAQRWLNWALLAVAEGTYAGYVQATVAPADGAATLGYVLFVEHWGKGYAAEAVAAVCDHLCARGVALLTAFVEPGNARSRRLLDRLGFAPAGAAGGGELRYERACAAGSRPPR